MRACDVMEDDPWRHLDTATLRAPSRACARGEHERASAWAAEPSPGEPRGRRRESGSFAVWVKTWLQGWSVLG